MKILARPQEFFQPRPVNCNIPYPMHREIVTQNILLLGITYYIVIVIIDIVICYIIYIIYYILYMLFILYILYIRVHMGAEAVEARALQLQQQLVGLELEASPDGLHLLQQRHLLVMQGMRPVLQERHRASS